MWDAVILRKMNVSYNELNSMDDDEYVRIIKMFQWYCDKENEATQEEMKKIKQRR